MVSAAFTALIFMSANAHCGDYRTQFTLLGLGGASCGSWSAARTRGDADTEAIAIASWVTGYLSGYNHFNKDTASITENVDTAATLRWVDNYCRKNPLNPVAAAADSLIAELVTPNR
jgi:hypothetical protein